MSVPYARTEGIVSERAKSYAKDVSRNQAIFQETTRLNAAIVSYRAAHSSTDKYSAKLSIAGFYVLNDLRDAEIQLEKVRLTQEDWKSHCNEYKERMSSREKEMKIGKEGETEEKQKLESLQKKVEELEEQKRWAKMNPDMVNKISRQRRKSELLDRIGQTECILSATELKAQGIQRKLELVYSRERYWSERRTREQTKAEKYAAALEARVSNVREMINAAKKRKQNLTITTIAGD